MNLREVSSKRLLEGKQLPLRVPSGRFNDLQLSLQKLVDKFDFKLIN